MYPVDLQAVAARQASQVGGNCPAVVTSQAAPQGIFSSMAELSNEINENVARIDNLRSALGISKPADKGELPQPSALIDVICVLTAKIRHANADLGDVLSHLNG